MEILLIGLAVAVLLIVLRLRRRDAGPAVTGTDPAARNASALHARLEKLGAALTRAGEASAHPRDVAASAAFREAVALLSSTDVPLTVVIDYAGGANPMFATAAFAALSGRDDARAAAAFVVRAIRHVHAWALYYALQYLTTIDNRPATGSPLIDGPPYWTDNPLVPGIWAEHFAARAALGDPPVFGDALQSTAPASLAAVETLLLKINHPAARSLLAELTAHRRRALDVEFLQSFGRLLGADDREWREAIEHDALRGPLAAAGAVLFAESPRSVLVVGEPRAGKTSVVLLLAAQAVARGWHVLEAGGAGLIAGQTHYGQLEERLRRVVTELAAEKRIVWYVPDLLQLALSGTYPGQPASILEQVLPAIASGRVVLLSEATPTGVTTVLQRCPALGNAVELVRLAPMTDAEGRRLADALSARLATTTGVAIAPETTAVAMRLAGHYFGADRMPGAALDLLKLAARHVATHRGGRMERDDLVVTLSKLTGLPRLVLDDRERVNLGAVRAFFAQRVIGQDEAVEVVVERIAMLKAGLTDPGRPIAVFLFAGPTGTGKTELARTLAEFLFGSADRLIRLDMSEFQAVEATRKILGDPDVREGGDALTHRVRRQPFSIVLLDEFEKAHPNVWDLFLQVFDAGRLTDAMGRTVDFRHCLIILTSNLGATISQQQGPGFASVAGGFSQGHVVRAVHQSFRPELVNRFDAVVVFRPLTRELMRGILANELARVLERRGLRDREWAVEWESSALDFLLEKGFSPAMGARPLKRAIDRHLLAPLAATLVEHRFPEGDQFLFVRSDGRSIQVEFVDPDAPDEPAPRLEAETDTGTGQSVARMILQAAGTAEERVALASELQRIDARLTGEAWASAGADLTASLQQKDFWSRPGRFAVLAQYAMLDRVHAAVGTARGLAARLERSVKSDGRCSRDLVARLALQLHVVRHGIEDVLSKAPVEIVLTAQPMLDASAEAAAADLWCQRIVEMYRQWASRRHAQWEDVLRTSLPGAMAIVSGFGATRVLTREAGLHVLEYEDDRGHPARAVVLVRVAPTPDPTPEAEPDRSAALRSAIERAAPAASVVRRYRDDPSPLVRDAAYGWRSGRQDLVLRGDFDLIAELLQQDA